MRSIGHKPHLRVFLDSTDEGVGHVDIRLNSISEVDSSGNVVAGRSVTNLSESNSMQFAVASPVISAAANVTAQVRQPHRR